MLLLVVFTNTLLWTSMNSMTFLNPLLENIATDNKKLFLVGDFNIYLLKVDIESPTTKFFDIITAKLLAPKIYSNSDNFADGISGNLTLTISDHLAQFLIIQAESKKTPAISNIYKRDVKNFDRENVLLDLLAIEWDEVISVENKNSNESFNYFSHIIDSLVNKYILLKKLTNHEIKNKFKP